MIGHCERMKMTRMRIPTMQMGFVLLTLSVAGVAWGQTEPRIQLLAGTELIGAQTCASDLAEAYQLSAEHTGSSSENYTLEIVYFTHSRDCVADNITSCPEYFLDTDSLEACGCIESGSVSSDAPTLSTSFTFDEQGGLVDLLCASNQTITFSTSVRLAARVLTRMRNNTPTSPSRLPSTWSHQMRPAQPLSSAAANSR